MKNWRELSRKEKLKLISNGSINGCGASKGLDLDPIIEGLEGLFWLPETFAEDIKVCACYPHDYAYLTRTGVLKKILSDIEFGLDLDAVLADYEIGLARRSKIVLVSVCTLLLFWMKAYNS